MHSTIVDVAKLAGVSRQTVSRVINNPQLVNTDTLEKVIRAMGILDYHPNIAARNLANKYVKSIGLFMPFSIKQANRNPFFSIITSTICHYCANEDFVFQLFTTTSEESYSYLFKRLYREKRIGGLVITCPSIDTGEINDLIASGVPFVLIGRPPIEIDVSYVDQDNVQAGFLATKYVLEKGHRDIVFFNASEKMTLSNDYNAGIGKAYADFGFSPEKVREFYTDLTMEDGYDLAKMLLQTRQKPTVIITADDLLALGVKKAADELGLRIPQDLALISMTVSGWGDIIGIHLTHVTSNIEHLGILAAQHLISTILTKEQSKLQKVLPVELAEGESC